MPCSKIELPPLEDDFACNPFKNSADLIIKDGWIERDGFRWAEITHYDSGTGCFEARTITSDFHPEGYVVTGIIPSDRIG